MKPALVTIPNVPLIEVGMDWPAMTGSVTVTREDLLSVASAHDDPGVPSAKLKLTLIEDTHGTAITEPCFGRATNVRFNEEDQTLYCDYEGVPSWLADILPAAWPGRSVELYHEVKTATGGYHKACIGAVQLLGVEWPGITTLDDLPLYYGKSQPETVELKFDVAVATMAKGGHLGRSEGVTKATVNVEDVRRAYYDKLDEQGNFAWWVKAVLLDPTQLVVEDEWEGNLYIVDFSISDSSIEFSDPKPVQIEYVEKQEKVAAAHAFVAGFSHSGREVLAHYKSATEAGREVKLSNHGTEGGGMTDEQRKELADKLGLPETATEEEVNAKLAEDALAATTSTAAENPGTGDGAKGGSTQVAATPDEGQPAVTTPGTGGGSTAAEALMSGTVQVDAEQWKQMQNDAKMGREARTTQLAAEDTSVLTKALGEGRFPPARLAHWKTMLENDREGTMVLLTAEPDKGGLAPGLVPVGQQNGHGGNGDGTDFATGEAYPQEWFPEVAARKTRLAAEAARGGRRVYTEAVS